MPKIIENLESRLIEEARAQLNRSGYAAVTIRSVAKAVGVGVGTVYNYFSSKDMLVASFMLEDWMACKAAIDAGCQADATPESALRCIYDELIGFIKKYEPLFKDESAGVTFASSFEQRHKLLCSQIAEPLLVLCKKQTRVETEFLAAFVAESMLSWTKSDCSFEKISSILLQLF